MNLIVNGEKLARADGTALSELLADFNPNGTRVAVMVNDTVIRSDERDRLVLQEDDRVEILIFAGGG